MDAELQGEREPAEGDLSPPGDGAASPPIAEGAWPEPEGVAAAARAGPAGPQRHDAGWYVPPMTAPAVADRCLTDAVLDGGRSEDDSRVDRGPYAVREVYGV